MDQEDWTTQKTESAKFSSSKADFVFVRTVPSVVPSSFVAGLFDDDPNTNNVVSSDTKTHALLT
jgi:hypothetical protein